MIRHDITSGFLLVSPITPAPTFLGSWMDMVASWSEFRQNAESTAILEVSEALVLWLVGNRFPWASLRSN